ncbi:kyphoscoliosis peptidase-like [Ascaphus truei]|uniref:kyphoscoliosis peptidase-like n=1 Tax=Ascaphus truei TaxID=8439 RepID=UPI003F598898
MYTWTEGGAFLFTPLQTHAYPWDGYNMKSLPLDLKQFEELDAFASQVKAKKGLKQLVRDLRRGAPTELEMVRAIWIWICHNIKYDIIGLKVWFLRSENPSYILRMRKGVCAGYASLFRIMCSIAGIKCLYIVGNSKEENSRNLFLTSNHAWNVVSLYSTWHLVDCTFGAGVVGDKFEFKYNEFYFLTHPALFIESHFPDNKRWQLLQTPLPSKVYKANIIRNSSFYTLGLMNSTPESTVIKTVNGKATVTIRSRCSMVYRFSLNGKEDDCLMTLMEFGMTLEVFPKTPGKHTLEISAKPYSFQENSYDYVLKHFIHCDSVDPERKLPKNLGYPMGPGWLSEQAGLHHPSQPDPIIHTPEGLCVVSFRMDIGVEVYATLRSDSSEDNLSSQVRQRHVNNMVEFSVSLPQAGAYVLEIWAKPLGILTTCVCTYVVSRIVASVE